METLARIVVFQLPGSGRPPPCTHHPPPSPPSQLVILFLKSITMTYDSFTPDFVYAGIVTIAARACVSTLNTFPLQDPQTFIQSEK